jgi:DNA-binding transcriptional regulator YiaG
MKEDKQTREQVDYPEKLGVKNRDVLYHELKSVETQYLQMWKKFNDSKAYTEIFLGIGTYLAVLYLELDRLSKQISKVYRPLHHKQTKLLFKRTKLEQKYENSNEIFKEIKKLNDEKNALFNKQKREENNLLSPESISQSRLELEITRKEFLRLWKKYMKNSTFEKEFVKCSNKYAKLLSKIKTQKEKIRKWLKGKPYNKMLRENYVRRIILEDKLLDNAGEPHV